MNATTTHDLDLWIEGERARLRARHDRAPVILTTEQAVGLASTVALAIVFVALIVVSNVLF
jgi:hypothetical protein